MLCWMPSMYEGIERVGLQVDGRLARARACVTSLAIIGIVEHGDLAALEHAGVVAHGAAVLQPSWRRPVAHEAADGGQEVAVGVLGVDAALHRPALELHVRLLERELLAGRDADHLLDEVDAGDELGDGMLDLQARVHLQEEEASGPGRRRTPPCRR